jgi:hypothetical protein
MHAHHHPRSPLPIHGGQITKQPSCLLGADKVFDVAAQHDDVQGPSLIRVIEGGVGSAFFGRVPETTLVSHEPRVSVYHLDLMLQGTTPMLEI